MKVHEMGLADQSLDEGETAQTSRHSHIRSSHTNSDVGHTVLLAIASLVVVGTGSNARQR